mgnify:CR=1 FL=1
MKIETFLKVRRNRKEREILAENSKVITKILNFFTKGNLDSLYLTGVHSIHREHTSAQITPELFEKALHFLLETSDSKIVELDKEFEKL